MIMEELQTQKKKYSRWTMASYGSKGLLIQWVQGAFGVYVYAFYEIYVGLDSILAATAFILFAVWNAFNDPLIGYIMETKVFSWTRKKGYRRFPWYLIAVIPWIGSYMLIFLVPQNWDASPESSQKWFVFAWYLVSVCLYDFLYSIVDVNSQSIYPEKFVEPKSRKNAQAFVTAFGILGIVLAFTIPPMLFPEKPDMSDYRFMGYFAAAVGLLLVLPTIPGHFEDKNLRQRNLDMIKTGQLKDDNEEGFFKTIGTVIKNRNFMGKISIFFGYQLSSMLLQSGALYILLFVIVESEKKLTLVLAPMLAGALIFIPFWLFLAKKTKNNALVCLIASILMTLSFVPMIFSTSILAWALCMALFGAALGAQWFIDPPLLTDVMDDLVVKTGKRRTSVYWGIQTFFLRFNNAIVALIFVVVHQLTGFVEGVTAWAGLDFENGLVYVSETPYLARFGIVLHSVIIPMGVMAVSTIMFLILYRLTPAKIAENRKKIAEMKIL